MARYITAVENLERKDRICKISQKSKLTGKNIIQIRENKKKRKNLKKL